MTVVDTPGIRDSGPRANIYAEELFKALVLKKDVDRRLSDLEARNKEDPETVIYALDSDLIRAYFHPLIAREDDPLQEYLPLFSDVDDPEGGTRDDGLSKRIAASIARSIVDRLNPDLPHLLLPGHDDDVREIYNEISTAFAKGERKVRPLKSSLQRFRKLLVNNAEDTGDHLSNVWQELNVFDLPHVASTRYLELLTQSRIASLSYAASLAAYSWLSKSDEPHPFEPMSTERHPISFRFDLKLNQALAGHKGKNRLSEKHRRALSALIRVNRRLPDNCRLVLITANANVHQVARQLMSYPLNATFADRYLRRPQCFLMDAGLLDPDGQGPSTDRTDSNWRNAAHHHRDWLDAFLVSFDRDIEIDRLDGVELDYEDFARSKLRHRAIEAINADEIVDPASLAAAWRGYMERAVGSTLAHNSLVRSILVKLIEEQGDDADIVNEIGDLIDERTETSWNRFFQVAVRTGFDLVRDPPSSAEIIKHALPVSLFTHYSDASYVSRILINGLNLDVAKGKVLDAIGRLEAGDPTKYTQALAFALLFAYADQWAIADLLARRAIKIYERHSDWRKTASETHHPLCEDGRISGREAFYIAACLKRVLAEDVEQLDIATGYLEKARRALQAEKDNDPQTVSVLTGLRFASEQASLEVTAAMLMYYREARRNDSSNVADQLTNAMVEAENVLSQAQDIDTDPTDALWLKRRLRLNQLTNLFVCMFLCEKIGRTELITPHLENIENRIRGAYELSGGKDYWYYSRVPSRENAERFPAPSRIDRVACTYAMVTFTPNLLGTDFPDRAFLQKEIRTTRFLMRQRKNLVVSTVYDEPRYEEMFDLIENHVSVSDSD